MSCHDHAIPGTPLRPREKEALILLAQGHTNAQIAQAMGIATSTVVEYTKSIFMRLEVNSRAQAAVWAAKQGLV